MAYNNPATGGVDMSPALLKRLLKFQMQQMIKESSGDIQRMHYLRKELGENVAFFNGSNPLALAAFSAGAKGWCTAASNFDSRTQYCSLRCYSDKRFGKSPKHIL